jgi:peptidylprolyl isomerase
MPDTTGTSTPSGANVSGIAEIPAQDRSPAGTSGKAPTVVVPSGSAPTQLEMADLIEGTGPVAEDGDSISVQYVLATYSSRKVIQSSWTSKPFTFTLGQGQVIPGWDQGVVGMRVGGRRELIIPPSLGYGAQSPGAGIAPNDTLVFVVDLLKIG